MNLPVFQRPAVSGLDDCFDLMPAVAGGCEGAGSLTGTGDHDRDLGAFAVLEAELRSRSRFPEFASKCETYLLAYFLWKLDLERFESCILAYARRRLN